MSVSVVIPCHNGARRLRPTLEALKAQSVASPWEVILVDNASTDGTAELAAAVWGEGPVPLRIIAEPRLGSQNARMTGLRAARYDFVSLVDDDNWLAPDWIARVESVMTEDPGLGAVGGLIEPEFEITPPAWFARFQLYYAIVTADEPRRPPVSLCSAGLTLRKRAWQQLIAAGFTPLIPGRVGNLLTSGEDTEITLALNLAGWKLAIDDSLRMCHWMPAGRLTWAYLRRLTYYSAHSHVLLDGYYHADAPDGLRDRLRQYWWWHFLAGSARLLASREFWRRPREGDPAVIKTGLMKGHLRGLLANRRNYRRARQTIRQAAWRKRGFPNGPLLTD